MGQFLRNLTDGSLRCRYCGDNTCTCMEEGYTNLGFCKIWAETEWSYWIQFKKQKLPCGKKIPAGIRIWVNKRDAVGGYNAILKTIGVNNLAINKWVFDP